MGKIELDNLLNTRDLGGLKTIHGYKIKKKRIIRSGRLFEASNFDIETLTNDYDLKTIIDLRSLKEVDTNPDPVINGVIYNHIPIFEGSLEGISREKEKKINETERLIKSLSRAGNVYNNMKKMYPAIVSESYAKNSFNSIFKVLINNTEGSVLYHCSAGKDRVGVLTLLLLSTLGVETDDIINDYLQTNKYYEELIQEQMEFARSINIDEDIVNQIPYAQGVQREYLDEVFTYINNKYDTIDNYIRYAVGINDEDILKLRSNYLEK
ncbi:MAG: tyrosine-protein phosphatase [Erysipelotrichaceae bacterium]|nr:tyrosine-protein phosphatase [Erysipelotrichaceae bacterium]